MSDLIHLLNQCVQPIVFSRENCVTLGLLIPSWKEKQKNLGKPLDKWMGISGFTPLQQVTDFLLQRLGKISAES